MKRTTKFSDVLHILLHMASPAGPLTSETLAKSIRSNPVVVRRAMAGLRESGFVQSEKGHGGGWRLSRDLHAITLYDVYVAIGAPAMFAIGNRDKSPECLVEQAVSAVTKGALDDAQKMLVATFHAMTLGQLHDSIKNRACSHGRMY